jgi:hypothetical protein
MDYEDQEGAHYQDQDNADWWKDEPKPVVCLDYDSDSTQIALEKEFNERANRWEKEAAIHSAPGMRFFNDDLIRIMVHGDNVVALILNRLKTSKADWIWALERIVPEDQHPISNARKFDIAVKARIEWGKHRGYID